MKQISNWVFGSFFRTIGRLLVFVLLGIIISNLIDFGSLIDNFKIKDLFFTKVNASQIPNGMEWHNLYSDSNLTTQLPYSSNYAYQKMTANQNGISYLDYYFNSPITKTPSRDYISFAFLLMGKTYTNINSTITQDDEVTCRRFYCESYDIDGSCARWKCDQWYTASNGNTDTISIPTEVNLNFNIMLRTNAGDWVQCEIRDNMAMCPLVENYTYNYIRVEYNYPTNNSMDIRFGVNRYFTKYINESTSINSSINSQTQQQHSDHQETQNYLEDSNTTTAENSASSFFSSFSVNLGGLTGIITAPLNTIQSLLNSTCTNLVLPLPFVNKNLTLPCMNDIYTEHFGLFFTLYQTIILGIIAYRCIMSIFFDIKGFTNPDDDRIEVMDL